ncbi:hypothetical protein BESB_019600 [Besnoitia besnoiti]|uniref:Uncharacterized protein n=1 Tax=Besnoitia besnoiti TaxID=94643 RepID=A0A2A9M228_BESBE|nr:hypothetical protein BESB_019600 [Besnoitia besnoiti]PFH32019.1 hypothetical protein BESB_019600 [Besnoitia besnoiti]
MPKSSSGPWPRNPSLYRQEGHGDGAAHLVGADAKQQWCEGVSVGDPHGSSLSVRTPDDAGEGAEAAGGPDLSDAEAHAERQCPAGASLSSAERNARVSDISFDEAGAGHLHGGEGAEAPRRRVGIERERREERACKLASSFPLLTAKDDRERKLDMPLEELIEEDRQLRLQSEFESERRRQGGDSWTGAGDPTASSRRDIGAFAQTSAEKINALLSMTLDDAAAVLQNEAHSFSTFSFACSNFKRSARVRPAHRAVRGNGPRRRDDAEMEEVFEQGEGDQEGEDEEAGDDDLEVDPWLRAFRKTVLLPLATGTRGWKYLAKVERDEPQVSLALIAYSGSGLLSEVEVGYFFELYRPLAVLQLVSSSFFVVLFPSAAAAQAALIQGSEKVTFLLAAGAPQLRDLQASARAAWAEARRRREIARTQGAAVGDRRRGPGSSRGKEDGEIEAVGEMEEEVEEGEIAEVGARNGRSDECAEAGGEESEDGGMPKESSEEQEREEGEIDDGEFVSGSGHATPRENDADLPEVFWLLEDVEQHIGAHDAEIFMSQVEYWRRTLPVASRSSPPSAGRLLLRVATAKEITRCARALQSSSPPMAKLLYGAVGLPGRGLSRARDSDLACRELLPSGAVLCEAEALSPAFAAQLRRGAAGDEGSANPSGDLRTEVALDEIQRRRERDERRRRRDEPEARQIGKRRLHAGSLEDDELAREQTLLTSLGGDFRSRFVRGRTGALDFREESDADGSSLTPEGSKAPAEAAGNEETRSWSKKLSEAGGRSHGMIRRFSDPHEDRPSKTASPPPPQLRPVSKPRAFKRREVEFGRRPPRPPPDSPHARRGGGRRGASPPSARERRRAAYRMHSRERKEGSPRRLSKSPDEGGRRRARRGAVSLKRNAFRGSSQDNGPMWSHRHVDDEAREPAEKRREDRNRRRSSDALRGEEDGGKRRKGRGFAYGVIPFSMVAEREYYPPALSGEQ